MLNLDIIGLVLSWLLLGPRYPGYIVLLSLFQEGCRFFLAQALETKLLSITIGGIFGVTAIEQGMRILPSLLIFYSGPFFCYLMSQYKGGLKREEGRILLNPFAVLANPVAVIAWRFSIFSALISTWRILGAV